ncbi:MAG TPA: hypothetical protein VGV92_08940 [Gammaproteobacteria bacterium]|nr:hypothetical protein [Gammaproteobacteria bacterium]
MQEAVAVPVKKDVGIWALFKQTYPIILTRTITATLPPLITTLVVSREGASLLAKATLPLAGFDLIYYSVTALYGAGISDIKLRIIIQDNPEVNPASREHATVIEYLLAGTTINAVAIGVLGIPLYLGIVFGLQVNDVKLFLGLSLLDLWFQSIAMLVRQAMVGSGYTIWKFDGAHVSAATTLLYCLPFFLISEKLVPLFELDGLIPGKGAGIFVKLSLDSLFLMLSGKVFRMPRKEKVWQDIKLIIGNGWKVSAQNFIEMLVFFGGFSGYAYLRGDAAQAAVRIGLTWDAVANPFQGAWSRGMQRLMTYDMHMSEKTKIVLRSIFMTLAVGAVPMIIGEFFPQELTSAFTNSTAVLQESAVVMRTLFGGQYFYGLTAITQFALWLLFNDTGFALGASVATAAVFFVVTLPLLLEDIASFDITTMVFVGCMATNAFAALAWYVRRVRNGGEISPPAVSIIEDDGSEDAVDILQGENLRSRGLFRCCCKPEIAKPETRLLVDSTEYKDPQNTVTSDSSAYSYQQTTLN